MYSVAPKTVNRLILISLMFSVPRTVPPTTSQKAPIATTSWASISLSSVDVARAVNTVVATQHDTTVTPTTEGSGMTHYIHTCILYLTL